MWRHATSISPSVVIVVVTIVITIPGTLLTIRMLQELVQFAAIKPYAPASWTVIDFYSLSFAHLKLNGGTVWAFHNSILNQGLRRKVTIKV
jgi:hypothetical protein